MTLIVLLYHMKMKPYLQRVNINNNRKQKKENIRHFYTDENYLRRFPDIIIAILTKIFTASM